VPNDLAALVGRRLVTSSETNEAIRLNEGRVKALTGGDPITARFLHREFFTFHPVAKFWLSVNHKPRVTDEIPTR
jgi:putative DNA primase/helicase